MPRTEIATAVGSQSQQPQTRRDSFLEQLKQKSSRPAPSSSRESSLKTEDREPDLQSGQFANRTDQQTEVPRQHVAAEIDRTEEEATSRDRLLLSAYKSTVVDSAAVNEPADQSETDSELPADTSSQKGRSAKKSGIAGMPGLWQALNAGPANGGASSGGKVSAQTEARVMEGETAENNLAAVPPQATQVEVPEVPTVTENSQLAAEVQQEPLSAPAAASEKMSEIATEENSVATAPNLLAEPPQSGLMSTDGVMRAPETGKSEAEPAEGEETQNSSSMTAGVTGNPAQQPMPYSDGFGQERSGQNSPAAGVMTADDALTSSASESPKISDKNSLSGSTEKLSATPEATQAFQLKEQSFASDAADVGFESVVAKGSGETKTSSELTKTTTERAVLDTSKNDFSHRLGLFLQQSAESGKMLKVRLDPPELGTLQIEVGRHNGQLTARFEVESVATQQMILEQLHQLRDSLQQQGLKIDQIEVEVQEQGLFQQQGHPSGQKQFAGEQDAHSSFASAEQTERQSEQDVTRVPDPPLIHTSLRGMKEIDIQV